ncbi:MAG TPA: hypothetical protein VFV95_21140 [Vicinamibacterales bacterium]|nr:hypothetical protein [Vicinamibacterales bacterium]
MSRMTGLLAGVAGTVLAAAVALAQAPSQDGGRQGGQAGQGAQAPARGGQQGGGQQGRGRGAGRGGDGGGQTGTSFFITSVGKGDGGNLGGLAGADAHCAQLAKAAGLPAAGRTWRAYLSTTAANGQPAVNARDRIGAGPWYNAKGVLIASNVADLHGDIERDRNQISKATALTEKGTTVGGVGDTPNQHDILTGSSSVGRAVAGTTDTTCSNWTSNMAAPAASAAGGRAGDATGRGGEGGRAAGGAATASDQSGPGAIVGHHDRQGDNNSSWNSARRTRGCSQENFVAAGGAGLFYCFAAN